MAVTKLNPVSSGIQTGEVWINNNETAVCSDCNQQKPILRKYVLANGKVLSCACADCYSSYYQVA